MTDTRGRIRFYLFIFLLIFSPLAFGTVEAWSLAVMETLSIFGLFLSLRSGRGRETGIYEVPGIVPLLCLWVYCLFQVLPLPAAVVKLLSPATFRLYAGTVGTLEPAHWISLSIYKKETLRELLRLSSYIAFYILTIQVLSKKEPLKKAVTILIIFSSSLSFLGIMQYLFYNKKIFWLRELTLGGTPFGPFVNRNHYAGFVGMVFPVVLAIFLALKPKVYYTSFRERLYELFSRRQTHAYILIGLASVLLSTSLFLSLSRGGIVSLSLSMIFLGIMLIIRRGNSRRGVVIIIICVLIVLSVGWFGWDPILERFGNIWDKKGDVAEMRPIFWRDTMLIVKDFPVTGTGFGSFVSIYPAYRTASLEGTLEHAHNDYLELLAEGGVIAFFLMGWFIVTVFWNSYRRFRERKGIYSLYLYLGASAGLFSILIHSATDFNLHIGANGLYFFFLFGLLVSAANTRLREGTAPTHLKPVKLNKPWLLKALTVAALAACIVINGGILAGEYYFSLIRDIRLNTLRDKDSIILVKDAAHRAAGLDPLEPLYHFAAANTETALSSADAARALFRRAVELSPARGEYLQRLGLAFSELGDVRKAEELLESGIKFDRMTPERYKRYAAWLLAQGRKDEGMGHLRYAVSLEPLKTRDYITLLVLYGMTDEDIRRALPNMTEPHLIFADYLDKTGKEDMAGEEYLYALGFIKGEKPAAWSQFSRPFQYFRKKGMHDKALVIINRAVEMFPDSADIGLAAAEAYEAAGIKYRAVEEYRRVLIFAPGNEKAKKRIAALLFRGL
ncbi:MAG: O-antigen ligase family protein [Nitrospirae bacterium]|nr:O-antigen ligase family protein [Nitrospirota bacterium]